MTQAYAQLLSHVHLVRRLWKTRRALEGLLLLAAVFILVLAGAAIIDQATHMMRLGRLLLAAVLWLSAFSVAWRYLVMPLLARHSDDYFAALVEQRLPAIRNRLINALQLGRDENHAAPRLVEAIVSDGITATDELDTTTAVSSPAMKRHGITLGVALALFALYVFLGGQGAHASIQRVLLPLADIKPFTLLSIESVSVKPGPRVLEGANVTVEALVTSRDPSRPAGEARIYWSADGKHWRSATMTPGNRGGDFGHQFPGADASFTFYVSAGDARSNDYAITVDPRPRIEAVSVTYRYPAYTGLPEKTLAEADGHLRALPGSTAIVTLRFNKDLEKLDVQVEGKSTAQVSKGSDARAWVAQFSLVAPGTYQLTLHDTQGYPPLVDPTKYTMTLEVDAPPVVAITRPGRDVQRKPEDAIEIAIVAQDDLGVGPVQLLARINPTQTDASESAAPIVIKEWPTDGPPKRRIEASLAPKIAELNLKAGDRMQYWAVAHDRNDVSPAGPCRGESRKFIITVLSAAEAAESLEAQIADYNKVITELIKQQRLNRAGAAALSPGGPLVQRQGLIRRTTQQLADLMDRNAFPAQTMIVELRDLANGDMTRVVSMLEGYQASASALDRAKTLANESLPVQDRIIETLEGMLRRLDRDAQMRERLKKLKDKDPEGHKQALAVLDKMASDLDKFLNEMKELDQKFERMNKDKKDDATGAPLEKFPETEQRNDRLNKIGKDSVDAIAKLPSGSVKDSSLAENVSTIFEEIEKKGRGKPGEIATPMEEGAKMTGTEVLEDLEIWMPDRGDSIKWTMEDPMEGKFAIPPMTLPDNLQDMMGDLVEDVTEFDEEADDTTSSWGGNLSQAGWDIADGPISSFSALGKTGNQLPNDMEVSGRSGEGRRGKSSGQSVGDTSDAKEGRPTPARVTNEPYEEGQPTDPKKQLDPRGSTGGGKVTGGGAKGLQGGTPPPQFEQDMQRLADNQKLLRERAENVARALDQTGRPASSVNRAIDLMKAAEQDYRDLRYDDAARKRKSALNELRSSMTQADQSVSMSLQKAPNLPPDLRQQITAGSQQALPEGYEDLVGEYYKALSGSGEK